MAERRFLNARRVSLLGLIFFLASPVLALTGGKATSDPRLDGVLMFGYQARRIPGEWQIVGGRCSAAVVGRHTLLTAGHCVERWADVATTRGMRLGAEDSLTINGRGALRDISKLTIASARIHPLYKRQIGMTMSRDDGNPTFDLAVIRVKENIGAVIYDVVNDISGIFGASLLTTGYGCDRLAEDKDSVIEELKVGWREASKVLTSQIVLPRALGNAATSLCPGDSGGPTFVEVAGRLQIVGINSSAATKITFISRSKNRDGSEAIRYAQEAPDFSDNFITRVDQLSDQKSDLWLRNQIQE